MPRFFNTAGPCKAELHYVLPLLERLPTVRTLFDQQCYFVLHAPRQIGKTTTLMALAQQLTTEGKFAALHASCEAGEAAQDDYDAAERIVLDVIDQNASWQLAPELRPPPWPTIGSAGNRLSRGLQAWSQQCPRPILLFLDEIDALRGESLRSVLRQIRAGYPQRPGAFPSTILLCGLRDVRDYKLASGGDPTRLGSSSPFNIKVESLTLRNFTCEEVAKLYAQHTKETGQCFEIAAVERAFFLTAGHPWLVNALARQATEVLVPNRTQPITVNVIEQAKELLIRRQDTHLDSLTERLREPRVQALMEPILAGLELPDVPADDRQYLLDLGLVMRDQRGGLVIANPIYQEVIPRSLAQGPQDSLPVIHPTWLSPDGRLDQGKLLASFLSFWRHHGDALLRSAPYHEIAPHLVLMAFLHRVVNGGGSLTREYAIGSGRMDLLLTYGEQKLALELKVWRPKAKDPKRQGLEQLDRYLEGLGLTNGWLIIFDRRKDVPQGETRTRSELATTPTGRRVTVIRA